MKEPLHFREMGSGPPLVLVHGDFSDGPMTWGPVVDDLAAAYRVLMVDRRGHGESPVEPRPYTIAGDAQDLLEVMERAGTGPVHLMGHSYGALVALELACKAPQRVRSLHLMEAPYLALLPRDPHVAPLNAGSARVFARASSLEPEAITEAFYEVLGGPELVARLKGGRGWPMLLREAGALPHTQLPGTFPAAVASGLQLGAPIWVYHGQRSHPGLIRVSERLAELLPGAALISMPDATHALQRAPTFVSLVLRTLGQVEHRA